MKSLRLIFWVILGVGAAFFVPLVLFILFPGAAHQHGAFIMLVSLMAAPIVSFLLYHRMGERYERKRIARELDELAEDDSRQ